MHGALFLLLRGFAWRAASDAERNGNFTVSLWLAFDDRNPAAVIAIR
jgi:hypothetical protein